MIDVTCTHRKIVEPKLAQRPPHNPHLIARTGCDRDGLEVDARMRCEKYQAQIIVRILCLHVEDDVDDGWT